MTNTLSLKSKLVLGAFCIAGVAGIALMAEANHSWGKYHWDLSTADTQANPLQLGDNLTTAAWKASLVLASDDWNDSVIKNEITTGGTTSSCSPTLGRVEVCNDEYGENNWLGIASVWAYRGKDAHIAQATVKLNDTYFNRAAYNTDAWRNLVMCQEVGHTFGLGHQDENFYNENLGTCMDYTADPDGSIEGQRNNEHPNTHDYEQLASIYAHLNEPSTGGGGGGGGNGRGKKNQSDVALNILGDGPSAWGTAVAQDAEGRNSVFVRVVGNVEIITHVLWTLDYAGEDHHEHAE